MNRSRPLIYLLSALAALFSVCVAATSAFASGAQHRFFLAPDHRISCELASSYPGLGTFAYCQTMPPNPMSVTLKAGGAVKICHGMRCIGNPPLADRTLPVGGAVTVGPFRCTSSARAVSCSVASGNGFVISPNSLTQI